MLSGCNAVTPRQAIEVHLADEEVLENAFGARTSADTSSKYEDRTAPGILARTGMSWGDSNALGMFHK